ncbi:histidine kinase [Chitinophaga sp. 212800010-3]|uniref:sensor histidine kinase n=1 Tax=unclassified Chitinophaga TaxID=2619133 RepID=UPI002DF09BBD|nr:His-kinase domain-containing protein [Chitinophaga sp. 212800010-3]
MERSVVILLHIGYWILYGMLITVLLLIALRGPAGWYDKWYPLMLSPVPVICLLPGVIGFYSFYTILFNRFLVHRKIPAFLLMALLFSFIAAIVTISVLLLPPLHWLHHVNVRGVSFLMGTLMGLAAIHGTIGLVLKGFISWYGDIKLKEELNRRNHETEMALIRAQLNPHFLFNTINNIDVLIEKDAAEASVYLNKLSDIMRFMLYETREEMIPLRRELDYIEKYIALQRIRTSNQEYVQYELNGEPGNRMVAPMLLIAYIENAFKHAVHKREGPVVNIAVDIRPAQIFFSCENKYQRLSAEENKYNGLGNELLQRRLALLYPGTHTLDISDSGGVYRVNLTLQTNEN